MKHAIIRVAIAPFSFFYKHELFPFCFLIAPFFFFFLFFSVILLVFSFFFSIFFLFLFLFSPLLFSFLFSFNLYSGFACMSISSIYTRERKITSTLENKPNRKPLMVRQESSNHKQNPWSKKSFNSVFLLSAAFCAIPPLLCFALTKVLYNYQYHPYTVYT